MKPLPGHAAEATAHSKGEQTRQLILNTALRLFRERGYAQTTMRAIAAEAGVAVGNAYYYFDSKEQLIQSFYSRGLVEHRAVMARKLSQETDFATLLLAVMHSGIDVNTPYHAFAGSFFKNAAEPSSPLNPFSDRSSATREAAIDLFREVLAGSDAKLDPQLRQELPELLWLAWMGVILFWVHDQSPEQQRTRQLIEGAVPLIDRLVGLSRLRVLRPAVRQITTLIDTLSQR